MGKIKVLPSYDQLFNRILYASAIISHCSKPATFVKRRPVENCRVADYEKRKETDVGSPTTRKEKETGMGH